MAAGCGVKGGAEKPVTAVPQWVKRTPHGSGTLCAVGTSEPTYFAEDAKPSAAENARKEIAKTISVTINTIMVERATESRFRVDEATVSTVSSWATEQAVEGAVIKEYWYDKDGVVSQIKGVTYALACVVEGVSGIKNTVMEGLEKNREGK